MKQSCTASVRRGAAIGAAVAIVTASSAFGIGATSAMADEAPTSLTPATTVTTGTSDGSGGAASDPTSPTADETGTTPPVVTDDPAESPGPVPTPDATTDPTAAPEPSATTTAPAATAATAPAEEAPDQSAAAALAFPEGTSADAPLVLTATVGDTVSRTFTATGGSGTVSYKVRGANGSPVIGQGDFNSDFSFDGTTGTLSGSPRYALRTYTFQVIATSGSETAVEYVELTVKPGAPVGVTFSVAAQETSGLWQVEPDGTIWEEAVGKGRVRIVSDVPVATGTTLSLAGLAVDAYGNRVTGSDQDDDYPRSTVTSTVSSDRAVWDPAGANLVTFTEAGTRTVTVSEGGVSTSFTVVVTDEPFAFVDPSSADAPIAITPTAGEEFTRTFDVSGATDPSDLRYELRGVQGEPFDETYARNGLDLAVDPTTGVLTGTGTAATSFRFQVVATSGGKEAVANVEVTVSPAAFAKLVVAVLPSDRDPESETWAVDGDTITHSTPDGGSEVVDAVPARQGQRMLVLAVPVDAYGNAVADHDDLTITSDVASDRIAYDPSTAATWVTFEHASPHVVTVAYQDRTQDIRFDVTPTAATAGATTNTGSGRLAYTGAETSGPLAWALGLLAAGGGLLVHRLRRRRA
ncbi:hypothetical protein BIV03_05010 [Curtobacterium sp. MCBA15_016]|uniref:hypothetical protein n=1 Tax=Curtobacterium sp. MCBA15_016 TaxID=1898740 RepID=UPI0008DC8F7C|nr:hypothetical protein [Curtobacterium sp. MCBA15_016]OII16971.1 hypothetical protein BIV03_05010 [Curtobacterium sp. MCBA15_016]